MPLYTYPVPEGRPAGSSLTGGYSLPGVDINQFATIGPGGARIIYSAIYVTTAIVIDQLAAEITTQSVGVDFRMGLYVANTSWQPTALLFDSGAISCTGTGVKTASAPLVLAPDRYVTALMVPDNTVNFRIGRGGGRYGITGSTMGGSFPTRWQITGIGSPSTTAFTNPGTLWTASAASVGTGDEYYIWLRVTVP